MDSVSLLTSFQCSKKSSQPKHNSNNNSGKDWHKQYKHVKSKVQEEEDEETYDSPLAREVNEEVNELMGQVEQKQEGSNAPRTIHAVQWPRSDDRQMKGLKMWKKMSPCSVHPNHHKIPLQVVYKPLDGG